MVRTNRGGGTGLRGVQRSANYGSNVMSTALSYNNKRLTIFCCRNLIADSESDGVLSYYFTNGTFSPYCFVSAFHIASSEYLALGCLNLRKVFCMCPGIEMYMVCLL